MKGNPFWGSSWKAFYTEKYGEFPEEFNLEVYEKESFDGQPGKNLYLFVKATNEILPACPWDVGFIPAIEQEEEKAKEEERIIQSVHQEVRKWRNKQK